MANQDDLGPEEQEQAVISESFGVDPTLEIELSRQMMAGELMYATNTGWQALHTCLLACLFACLLVYATNAG